MAGTSRTRTIVASMKTAIAIPTPMLLIVIESASANAENTAIAVLDVLLAAAATVRPAGVTA